VRRYNEMSTEEEILETYKKLGINPTEVKPFPIGVAPFGTMPNDNKLYVSPVTGSSSTPTLNGGECCGKLE
jgi:hypothetical protein